nr:MAG TPA: hypothetical protein [Caudoviricetes sp.]
MFLFWFYSVGRLVCEDWPPLLSHKPRVVLKGL